MEYCCRCRKTVNVRSQVVNLGDRSYTSYFCEECGMSIAMREGLGFEALKAIMKDKRAK